MIGYGTPYMNMSGNYIQELQNMRDRIDSQIQQVQQQQQNMPQPPTNLTQNFQLANTPSTNSIRFVNDLQDVDKEIVLSDTYFLSNSLTNLWLKKPNGDIRTFKLTEIVKKDEKDLLIEKLQEQINELKGDKLNEYSKSNDELLHEQSITESNQSIGKQFETDKSSDVSIVSNRKTAKRKS